MRAEHLTLHQLNFPFPQCILEYLHASGRMKTTSCLPQISWRHPAEVPASARLLEVVFVHFVSHRTAPHLPSTLLLQRAVSALLSSLPPPFPREAVPGLAGRWRAGSGFRQRPCCGCGGRCPRRCAGRGAGRARPGRSGARRCC